VDFIAAASADARSEASSSPPIAWADTTFHVSSISTSTLTVPATLFFLASSGYSGCGNDMALPFTTPPEIVLVGAVCAHAADAKITASESNKLLITILIFEVSLRAVALPSSA